MYSVKLEQTKIRAPFSGFIQNRFLDSGTVVSPGIPIIEIIDSTSVEAHVSIPGSIIESLEIGSQYNFSINEKIYPATLKRFSQMTSQGSIIDCASLSLKHLSILALFPIWSLQQTINKEGAWVPLKSLSQGTQGLWNLYHSDQRNQ